MSASDASMRDLDSESAFPLRMLFAAALISVAAVGYLGWQVWGAYAAHVRAMDEEVRFLTSSAELKPLSRTLGHLARLHVVTGEARWKQAWRETEEYEHELVEMVTQAASQLGLAQAVAAFEDTHERLENEQEQAIALAADADTWSAASAILDGQRYAVSERLFGSSAANLVDRVAARRRAGALLTAGSLRWDLALAAGVLVLLAGGWAAVFAFTRRQQRRRREAERALLDALEAQDRLVLERTGALNQANARLEREAQARERASQQLRARGRALAAEMGRLNAVLENMDQGLTFFDRHGALALCNRGFLEMNCLDPAGVDEGMSAEQLRASAGCEAPVLPERALARAAHADPDERCCAHAVSEQHRNAAGRVFELRSTPLPGGGFVTVYTDRTEALAAERRLREVVEKVPCGILMVDGAGIIRLVNRSIEALFGYAREELVGQAVERLVPERLREPHARLRAGFGRSPEEPAARALGAGRELAAQRKDGSEFVAEVGLGRVDTAEGPMVLCVISDTTERRELQAQVLQTQKLESIGQLAAGIAHEINTPTQYVGDNVRFLADAFADLAPVHGAYARLREAAEGCLDPALLAAVDAALEAADWDYLREEIPGALEQAGEGVSRVARIVHAMKEFSHPGSEGKELADLNHVVENTVTVARNEWKYVAELELDLDPALPRVPCLPADLGQVVLNLVVNAAHAIAARFERCAAGKGHIRVATLREGAEALIRVGDDGTGIPEAMRQRVFEPFFTTKEVGRGTGQGLAIARNVVVERHGGRIDLESTEGQGSTFTVRLPLSAEAECEDAA